MLGVKTYTREYIDACRSKVDADLDAYRALAASVKDKAALGAFEPVFFNNIVILLDTLFTHRLRTLEGKDGNAMNEVRVLCNSILNNNGLMTAENVSGMVAFAGLTGLKVTPDRSVLKYATGDEIKVKEADFVALSSAFFAEIDKRFS